MKIKTYKLTGAALDWAVAKALGYSVGVYTYDDWVADMAPVADGEHMDAIRKDFKAKPVFIGEDGAKHLTSIKFYAAHGAGRGTMQFSTDWAQGGPIIEQEGIELLCNTTAEEAERFIEGSHADWRAAKRPIDRNTRYFGTTPLIAAMRCYVASKLGDEVDIPKGLL